MLKKLNFDKNEKFNTNETAKTTPPPPIYCNSMGSGPQGPQLGLFTHKKKSNFTAAATPTSELPALYPAAAPLSSLPPVSSEAALR